jgi:hypothetical protein
MFKLNVFVAVFVSAVVMSSIAIFLSVCTYALVLPGSNSVLRLAAWMTPGLFLRTLPIVLANGLFAAFLWPTRYRAALVLIAAAAGLAAGRMGSAHSPHVSPGLASLSSGFAWAIAAALFFLIFDAWSGHNRAQN